MRLWSIHPEYLDSKGLVALWREGLLAKAVLEGKTKGYVNHPQLERFKKQKDPVRAINAYLHEIQKEAKRRGFDFDESKIVKVRVGKISVTSGQIRHEHKHLLKKLIIRDRKKYLELKKIKKAKPHPLIKIVKGAIEDWEKIDKEL